MMSLHAEALGGDEAGSAEGPNSELAFQTHIMKVSNMVRTLVPCKLCHWDRLTSSSFGIP